MIERLLLVEQNLLFREGLAVLLEWETGLSSVHAGCARGQSLGDQLVVGLRVAGDRR